ncbi:nuclear transport factor 2 family protein [Pelorhabdus rhamnosifermentans]|uniref:nuclear transport factor 2 family protein n=1 Tax=Pelorhabdus rhamnosifermentans TaxID=2772457 RepID=UPI001C06043A|nr:nuclear transport factor 2 family protein [Pelorhabdus rhamnosifermentans]
MVNNNPCLVLEAAQKYLSIVKGASINTWMDIWTEDAVVEFPYAPDQSHKRLEGKKAIYEYYKNVSPVFELLEENPLVTYLSSDPLIAVFEISLKFRILSTEKDYDQDYIGVVKVRDDGRIVLYREYCDPLRVLESFQLT